MGLMILLSICRFFASAFSKSRIWKFYISLYASILLHIKAHWVFVATTVENELFTNYDSSGCDCVVVLNPPTRSMAWTDGTLLDKCVLPCPSGWHGSDKSLPSSWSSASKEMLSGLTNLLFPAVLVYQSTSGLTLLLPSVSTSVMQHLPGNSQCSSSGPLGLGEDDRTWTCHRE